MSLLLLNQQYNYESEHTYRWEILGPYEKTFEYRWTIYQAYEKEFSYSWLIHAFFERTFTYSWTIFQAYERAFVYSWRSMGFFLSSRILYHFRSKRRIKTFRRQPPGREDFK